MLTIPHQRASLLVTSFSALAAAQQPEIDPQLATAASAYAAKVVASAVFVSGRSLDSVLAEELAPDRPLEAAIRPLLRFDVDRQAGTVTCSLGDAQATAARTGNLGCTLVRADASVEALRRRAAPGLADLRPDPATVDWPLGDRMPAAGDDDGVDRDALQRAVDAAFAEPPDRPLVRTRALLVVCRGRIVAERYAPGYHADMPLPGWSMTKSIVNALVGIRVQQQKLDVEAPLAVPEWTSVPDDPRARIRLPHLLAMSSGLRWVEDYDDPASDALRMLFTSSDHAAAYAQQPVAAPPDGEFRYASGSTNLICRLLRGTFASDLDYWSFPYAALFGPLGMRTAVLETDPSGTFVGSSYGFASARDWARFCLLYAQDGVFGGQRLLPEGWVARSAIPVAASNGRYGRHLWLNASPAPDGRAPRMWPDLPADLLHMDGHEGQYCVVFPSQQIVIVRLGCTKNGGFDLHGMLRRVLAACGR